MHTYVCTCAVNKGNTRTHTRTHAYTHPCVYSVYICIQMYRMDVLGAGAFGSDLTRDLKSQCSHLDGNFRTRRVK